MQSIYISIAMHWSIKFQLNRKLNFIFVLIGNCSLCIRIRISELYIRIHAIEYKYSTKRKSQLHLDSLLNILLQQKYTEESAHLDSQLIQFWIISMIFSFDKWTMIIKFASTCQNNGIFNCVYSLTYSVFMNKWDARLFELNFKYFDDGNGRHWQTYSHKNLRNLI